MVGMVTALDRGISPRASRAVCGRPFLQRPPMLNNGTRPSAAGTVFDRISGRDDVCHRVAPVIQNSYRRLAAAGGAVSTTWRFRSGRDFDFRIAIMQRFLSGYWPGNRELLDCISGELSAAEPSGQQQPLAPAYPAPDLHGRFFSGS